MAVAWAGILGMIFLVAVLGAFVLAVALTVNKKTRVVGAVLLVLMLGVGTLLALAAGFWFYRASSMRQREVSAQIHQEMLRQNETQEIMRREAELRAEHDPFADPPTIPMEASPSVPFETMHSEYTKVAAPQPVVATKAVVSLAPIVLLLVILVIVAMVANRKMRIAGILLLTLGGGVAVLIALAAFLFVARPMPNASEYPHAMTEAWSPAFTPAIPIESQTTPPRTETVAEQASPSSPSEVLRATPSEIAAADPPGVTVSAEAPAAESPSADTKPADTKPADTKPADTKPADTKPADTKPAEAAPEEKPAETPSAEEKAAEKPAEVQDAEAKPEEKPQENPGEAKPADAKPAEKPEEPKPEEPKPADAEPPEEKPAEAQAAETKPAESPQEPNLTESKPEWIGMKPAVVEGNYRMCVTVGPYTTRYECDQQMPAKIRSAFNEYVGICLGPEWAGRIALPGDLSKQRLVKQQWEETVNASFGPMIQVHLLLDFDRKLKDEIHQEQTLVIITRRLWGCAGGLGGLLALLGMAYAGLKTDLQTGGRYRGRLVLAGAVVTVLLVAAALFVLKHPNPSQWL